MIDVSKSGHYVGDCRVLLRELPDRCVQTCVTSPPYWGLRDYGHEGQIGLEATPEAFVAELVGVFREVRRVLRDDGTLWVNIGDCYVTNPRGPGGAGSSTLTGSPDSERRRQRWEANGRAGDPRFDNARQVAVRALANPRNRTTDPRNAGRSHAVATSRGLRTDALKHKDLVGIPWMLAFALRADGWYLRADLVWSKPNSKPESVTDRPTKAHEYIFLLSKSPSYFYDSAAIAEPLELIRRAGGGTRRRIRAPRRSVRGRCSVLTEEIATVPSGGDGKTRNCRSVWTIATQPYDGAHFATMPPRLAERCILAGAPAGGLVLDPFFGSGTTGAVAEKHGRRWIGFDLGYEDLAKERTAQRSLPLAGGEVA